MTAGRIVVLGAHGFVGGHVTRLLESGPSAGEVELVTRPTGAARQLTEIGPGRWTADLVGAGEEEYLGLLRRLQPDTVINCVGMTSGDPEAMRATNVGLVEKLLRALARQGGIRLLHLGSAAEYGPGPCGVAVGESTECCPTELYGQTKLEATRAVGESGVQAAVLRLFNPVGAGMPETLLVGRAARVFRDATARGLASIQMGPLDAYRDYVDVRDVARSVVMAATASTPPAPVLNVAGGHAILNRTMVAALASVAGFTGTIEETGAGSARSAGLAWQQADVSLIRRTLGWEPAFSLEDSLVALWQAGLSTNR